MHVLNIRYDVFLVNLNPPEKSVLDNLGRKFTNVLSELEGAGKEECGKGKLGTYFYTSIFRSVILFLCSSICRQSIAQTIFLKL